ncbi:MAG: hypothetical protein ABI793_17395 [Flavobacterium sp.]
MKNLFVGVVLALILFSCKDSKEKKVKKKIKIVENTVIKNTVQKNEAVNEDLKNDFDILLPRSYRTSGGDPVAALTSNWIDLYEENGEYYLGKASYKIENGYDECAEDSLKFIIPENKSIVFMNYPKLKLGKIKSLKIDKNKIWPQETVTFLFNNVKYILRAEGKVLSSEKRQGDDDKVEIFKNVKNYKLYLSADNVAEKLLLQEEGFNDTFVELLFAGDIDGDGKLDLIFNASRDYEEERVILFLSSKAENGDAIKKVSEIAVQFDC